MGERRGEEEESEEEEDSGRHGWQGDGGGEAPGVCPLFEVGDDDALQPHYNVDNGLPKWSPFKP